ncbi:MAG: FtsX-like permease family protein [Chitinivibrionales bacterium]|nr:FtsX-like permease family protein [Chitinivibrionales bacterium]
MLFTLAWRNLWRNRRRTLITAASVFVAVVLSLAMRSMQIGSYDKMVRDVVENYTGYVQVHARGYWDDKTIENTFATDSALMRTVRRTEGVTGVVPRLESFALASAGVRTRGVQVVGIAPRTETSLTGLREKVAQGTYLETGDTAALVTEGLAEYLRLTVGDTIVLLGQGYRGVSAAAKFAVGGIVDLASPELNDRTVYLPLEAAQYMYAAPDRLTSLALDIADYRDASEVASRLRDALESDRYEVMVWSEMLTQLVQQIRADNAGGIIMIGILYMIIAFGIFGTVTMMTAERRREFGVVLAVGMQRRDLSVMLFVETVFIAILGVAAGIVASIPLLAYFAANPIRLTGDLATTMIEFGIEPVLPWSMDPSIFVNNGMVVLIVAVLCSLYPYFVIRGLEVPSALRGE